MNIVTLAECKERLHIDFNDNDSDITLTANRIESSLYIATGIKIDKAFMARTDENALEFISVAKDKVLTELDIEYYEKHSELNKQRLTYLTKQLQALALLL